MSEHHAKVLWSRGNKEFQYKTYDRTYTVKFGGGSEVVSSAAPQYLGKKELANPEEMFVAALSGCHMLTFLALAVKGGFIVDSYDDDAVGELAKNSEGKLAMTQVRLRPKISFNGRQPTENELEELHHQSHSLCFIASSVLTEVVVE